ncbi:MAG: SurA N-terminal domain-containing protein [Nanoarchaeota archaeon]
MAKKNTPKNSKKKNSSTVAIIIAAIVIIVILYVVIKNTGLISMFGVAAVVNGESITVNELDQKYENLPEQYKVIITKDILLDQLINSKLLIQESKKQGFEVTEEEIQDEIDSIKDESFESDEEFQQFLNENKISIEYLNKQTYDQILINKLLEKEIISKIEVSESKIKSFYGANKELLGNVSYDEVKEQIRESILEDLSTGAIETYVGQLRSKAEIIINGQKEAKEGTTAETDTEEKTVEAPKQTEEKTEEKADEKSDITTFKDTKDSVCMENNKPIIRFYTTSNCEPCDWIKDTFYSAVDKTKFTIYHWELDTGDNLATKEIETGIPQKEIDIFKKYNDKTTVPTYVFGCKYVRSGNGYSDLGKEKAEFQAVTKSLTQ